MISNTELAWQEFRAKHYGRAVQFAQYSLARDPDDTEALWIFGFANFHECHFADGIDALEHLSLLQPLDDVTRIELAIAYGSIGRTQLSLDLLMGIATSGNVESSELLRIATGLEAIDEPRLAMEACRQAGKQSPDLPEVHYQMGFYAQACGHPINISEALMRHAIDLDPRNLHFRVGLCSLLIRLGRKCEAVALIDRMIPERLSEVTCVCCLKRIANLFFDCDDVDRAKLCAERLSELQLAESRGLPAHPSEAVA